MNNVIKGFVPISLIDWPKMISSVIFLGGCNYRCATCHNQRLAFNPKSLPSIELDVVVKTVCDYHRSGWIDGVVISGGEPTIHYQKLVKLIYLLKEKNIPVCVHTNASNYEAIFNMQNFVDLFCVDIKCIFSDYSAMTGINESLEEITQRFDKIFSLATINPSQFMFRTTHVPNVSKEDLVEIKKIVPSGCRYCVQQFITQKEIINENI